MENLQELLDYLYALDGKGIRLGLDRVRRLYDCLGNPEKKLRIIHIAGTNGKGSTASFIASILREAGYRVGLYTSPHLVRFNERIRINDRCISDEEIVRFLECNRGNIDRIDTTFFETTTAMALDYFHRNKVDYCVLETGLGGRLDATNAVRPILSVITSIGKDHTDRLGKNLNQIAQEKAGILKRGIKVVTSVQSNTVAKVLREAGEKEKTEIIRAGQLVRMKLLSLEPGWMKLRIWTGGVKFDLQTSLWGHYQMENIRTAIAAILSLNDRAVTIESIIKGMERTFWPGRMQVLKRKPFVIYDVGHNSHGLRQVFETLSKLDISGYKRLLLSIHRNKDIRDIAAASKGFFDEVILTPNSEDNNSMPAELMRDLFVRYYDEEHLKTYNNFNKALEETIKSFSGEDSILLIAGSHYFAHLIYEQFNFSLDSYLIFD